MEYGPDDSRLAPASLQRAATHSDVPEKRTGETTHQVGLTSHIGSDFAGTRHPGFVLSQKPTCGRFVSARRMRMLLRLQLDY